MTDPAHQRQTTSPILKAISGRCPRCGQGRLFAGYLTVAERCNVCDLSFAGHDAADGPAVFITFVTGTVGAGGSLWLELAYAPPTWVHVVVWPPVIIALSVALLRPFKGAFVGAQYKYRAEEWKLGR